MTADEKERITTLEAEVKNLGVKLDDLKKEEIHDLKESVKGIYTWLVGIATTGLLGLGALIRDLVIRGFHIG